MELATFTQLKADLNTLGENLEFLKELKSENAEAKVLSEKRLQIMQNLLYILELGGEIVGAELSQEWHKKWNECKAMTGRELTKKF